MANCLNCNILNEYQDEAFVCYSCRTNGFVEPVCRDVNTEKKQTNSASTLCNFKFALGDVLVSDSYKIIIMGYSSTHLGYKYIYVEKDRFTNLCFADVNEGLIAKASDALDFKYNGHYNAWTAKLVEKNYKLKD